MGEKRSGLHIYHSGYVVSSNPCHNPAGPGGGQFCSGSEGGGDLTKDRNLSDGEIKQRILDDKLTNSIYSGAFSENPLSANVEGMSINDRLAYIKMYHETPAEFAFKDYDFKIKDQVGPGLSPDGIRAALKEKGLTVPAEEKPASFQPMANRTTYLEPFVKDLSSQDKDVFIERYPAVAKGITDKGHSLPFANPEHLFTVSQSEKMADGFDRIGNLKYINYNDKFSAAAAQFSNFSANKDFALSGLLGGWATSGGGVSSQRIIHSVSETAFGENHGISFYKFDTVHTRQELSENSFSRGRLTNHLQTLRAETEGFYRDKLGKKYDSKEVSLFRGVGLHVDTYTPSSAESWSAQKSTAVKFGKMLSNREGHYSVIETKIPISKVLWTYESVAGKYRWPEEKDLKGKKEFVVIGGAINNVSLERF